MEKNTLVDMSETQRYPAKATPGDFKAPSSKHGMMEGKDQLVDMSMSQWAPRSTEDSGWGSSGAGTPVEGRGGVAKSFPVGKSSAEEGTSMQGFCGIDLVSGQHTCSKKTS